MIHKQLISITVITLFLLSVGNISAQQTDSTGSDYWSNLLSNKPVHNSPESIKDQETKYLKIWQYLQ